MTTRTQFFFEMKSSKIVLNRFALAITILSAHSMATAQVVSEVTNNGQSRMDTQVFELENLVDSLQSALDLTPLDIVPETRSGSRAIARLDRRALEATLEEMFEVLGIEGPLPSRLTARNILAVMNTIELAAAETPPTVQTLDADNTESTSTTLHGAITKDGRKPLLYWGFKFGSDSTLSDSIRVPFGDYQGFLDTSAVDTGVVAYQKTGLNPSTTHYFSAWGENENGIAHGDTLSVLTKVGAITKSAVDMTDSSATILARFEFGDVQPSAVGLKWGPSSDLTDATDSLFILTSDSTIAWALTDLEKDSTYHFVAHATNTAGTQFGDTLSFMAISDACLGETSVTYYGHAYPIIGIGGQCWFAENLRNENYLNGDGIMRVPEDIGWEANQTTTTGTRSIYHEPDEDDIDFLALYGRLYNWYAVMDSRGLCPAGWHIPSDEEWTTLFTTLGGVDDAGAALTSSSADDPAWSGTNSSGFSGLPGGRNYADFEGGSEENGDSEGYWGYFWSTTEDPSRPTTHSLSPGISPTRVEPNDHFKIYGLSVRCLKD